MALSKRLFSIFKMVEKGSVVADIGCDHGLLAIALVQENICEHVVACDLRPGPLSRAMQAVSDAQLEDKITTLLRNGMDDLPKDVDTIVIAGMGFDTIKMILEAHERELPNYQRFIIQSNKHVEDLRRWISAHHFTIVQEDMVEEDHFYQIVAFTCTPSKPLSEDEILFGRYLENHPLFSAYWIHQCEKQEAILAKLPKHHENYQKVDAYCQRIKQKLQKMKEKEPTA